MEEKVYREILDIILEKNPKSTKELAKIKRAICKKYSLSLFPRNSDILQVANKEERELVLHLLLKKPGRTLSGVAVVAVMSKPFACPHGKCTMCPGGLEQNSPQSYTGFEPAAARGRMYDYDSYKQVRARIKQLEEIGHNVSKIDLILMGGTLPAAPLDYQEIFIKGCLDGITGKVSSNINESITLAETSTNRCIGITIETRPDTCIFDNVRRLLKWGVTRVEIGVQILNDNIYQRIKRGHTVKDVAYAFKVLRDLGLKVTAHVMVGLPGASWDDELRSYKLLINDQNFIPDELKIYPLMLMENTPLFQEYLAGQYQPLTLEETIRRVAEFKTNTPPTMRIKRILRDIPAPLIFAGPKKSDLREHVQKYLNKSGRECRCIRCREIGHKLLKGQKILNKDIELVRREYKASGGKEIFLSFEEKSLDIIFGFLRLRQPSEEKIIQEAYGQNYSIIREIHVYGSLVGVGKTAENPSDWQHRGLGSKLIEEAVRISKEDFGSELLLVTSGIGVREYYSKKGFYKLLPYMASKI